MDDELLRIIQLFQRSVAQRFGQIARYYNIVLPVTNGEWVDLELPHPIELPNGIVGFKHGFGISMCEQGTVTNFDLGDNGEIDGFNAGWLASFVQSHQLETHLTDAKIIQLLIDDAVSRGNIRFSGYINYYLSNG